MFLLAKHDALDRDVVGLSCTTGKEDRLWVVSPDECRDVFLCFDDSLLCSLSEYVTNAGAVAKLFRKIGKHLLNDSRITWSRRLIVEVDWELHR